jgi:murein DD-endopeptidase MepM/ murein hydrolase activator NlpD
MLIASRTRQVDAPGYWLFNGAREFACLFILMLVVAFPAQSQGRRVALVVGNGNYSVESRLANPVNDAELIARTLRGLGFVVEQRANLPKREMELTISRFVKESSGAESAVFYYAGHGAQPSTGGRNFLLPVDAKVDGDDALETDGIDAAMIVRKLERADSPARIRLIILDACRNSLLNSKRRGAMRGLSRMHPEDDYTLVAFSTNEGSVADDGNGRNSPYTQALARYLAKAAEVPVRRIFEEVAEAVRTESKGKQRPRTDGDLPSTVLLGGLKQQGQQWREGLVWSWPGSNEIISGFDADRHRGLSLGGKLGQPVLAAADGVVIQSGAQIQGYGNLVLIKHNDLYISAYAHNDKLLVKEGARVQRGQKIATLGTTETASAKLYFEIRKDAVPVDPLAYLPR